MEFNRFLLESFATQFLRMRLHESPGPAAPLSQEGVGPGVAACQSQDSAVREIVFLQPLKGAIEDPKRDK
eukprot:5980858-Pyramimonas_sp.AAC.1